MHRSEISCKHLANFLGNFSHEGAFRQEIATNGVSRSNSPSCCHPLVGGTQTGLGVGGFGGFAKASAKRSATAWERTN
jgi:hypothetical protein